MKLPAGFHTVTIPSNTLIFRAQGLQVGVVHGNGRSSFVPITIGHDFGSTVEVHLRHHAAGRSNPRSLRLPHQRDRAVQMAPWMRVHRAQ